jgi:hypothetical protein
MVPVDKIKKTKEFEYLNDEILLYLWEQAIKGSIQVYFAAIPFSLIEPYDKEFDLRKHPVGIKVVNAIIEEWKKNQFKAVWVYPKGDKYILSDDYAIYYAAVAIKPDYLPCYILGKPIDERIKDVKGPIAPKEIKSLIFGP